MSVSRPALPWYGSKWRLADWVLSVFPPHRVYVEPFGGSAAVLLRKRPAEVEVYNDRDAQVVNYFRVLRDSAARERLEELLRLTPYAADEYAAAHADSETGDEIERARRFFVRAWQGFGSIGASSDHANGFRRDNTTTTDKPPGAVISRWRSAVEAVPEIAARFGSVVVENEPATTVIRRYDSPETLIYADPPYIAETRLHAASYRHEMDEAGHRELAAVLHECAGMVVLSGFDHPLYEELFADWATRRRDAQTTGLRNGGRVARTEVLWLNAAAEERLGFGPLFDSAVT